MDKGESSAEVHLLCKVRCSAVLCGVFPLIILIHYSYIIDISKTSIMVVIWMSASKFVA